ncbi:MAG: cyclic nucleotide-binding/CBS domain-containing protein [Nitrososphaeraceae archaeon]|jgi:CBS domain-containing protein
MTTIGELMTHKLQTIEGSSSVRDAAKKMRDKNISSLVVVNSSNKPIGIITERDLVRKVCASDSSSKNTNVKDILSDVLVTTDALSEVGVAADIMIQNRVRHLLVVEGDDITKPLGIITPTDFAGYLKENLNIDNVNAKILESLKEAEAKSDKYE